MMSLFLYVFYLLDSSSSCVVIGKQNALKSTISGILLQWFFDEF